MQFLHPVREFAGRRADADVGHLGERGAWAAGQHDGDDAETFRGFYGFDHVRAGAAGAERDQRVARPAVALEVAREDMVVAEVVGDRTFYC